MFVVINTDTMEVYGPFDSYERAEPYVPPDYNVFDMCLIVREVIPTKKVHCDSQGNPVEHK